MSVRTAGKGSGAKGLSFDDVDHHLEKIKKDALSDMEDSGSMSSDDSEFNPGMCSAVSSLISVMYFAATCLLTTQNTPCTISLQITTSSFNFEMLKIGFKLGRSFPHHLSSN